MSMRVVCFREFEDSPTKTGDSGRITGYSEVVPDWLAGDDFKWPPIPVGKSPSNSLTSMGC
jgi:hypothetical protein